MPTRDRPTCWASTARREGQRGAQPRRLRARATDALRVDDRQRDRLVHGRLLRQRISGALSCSLAADYQLPPKRKIKSLSKGMRAKVSLSLALAHEPELLILDEPTSGLDTLVRREFLEGMVDIAAAGRTVLLSSHQIGEVERVADIVAILRAGKLLLVERLEDLKDQIRELTITLADDAALPPLGGRDFARAPPSPAVAASGARPGRSANWLDCGPTARCASWAFARRRWKKSSWPIWNRPIQTRQLPPQRAEAVVR